MRSRRCLFYTLATFVAAIIRLLSASEIEKSSFSSNLTAHPEAGSHSRQSGTNDGPTTVSAWPRVYIRDVYVRDAVSQALDGASDWLKAPKCQLLLLDFADERGRPLTGKLAELNSSLTEYLRILVFEDGESQRQCNEQGCSPSR